jgi:predicted membrane channel-forming protein YqfA (hemolysin III family)
MGFALVFIWTTFLTTLKLISMVLLITTGFFYVSGIIFYILGNYRPIFHAVWHLFVLIAAIINWFDVYFHIVTTSSMMTEIYTQTISQLSQQHAALFNSTSA